LASTARYRFEFQLFEWAEDLSKDLCGDTRCFFIGLRPEGSVRRIYFARPGAPFSGERKRVLADGHLHWFLYHPYGDPGAGYVEWYDLDQAVSERWLKRKLERGDFEDVRGGGALHAWPSSWRVIL
jgi:hypothetical protein